MMCVITYHRAWVRFETAAITSIDQVYNCTVGKYAMLIHQRFYIGFAFILQTFDDNNHYVVLRIGRWKKKIINRRC